MAVTQGSPVIGDLAVKLSEQIRSGAPGRVSFGDPTAAFGWAAGLPRGLWSFCATASVDGPGFNAIRVSPSGTPVAKVLEGGTKPVAVTLTPEVVALVKYAGIASATLEQNAYSDALPQVLTASLVQGALVALEADLVALAIADAGANIAGDTDWTSSILNGIGEVAGNGGKPDLLVMAPADFAKAVDGPSSLQFSGEDAILSYLGLQLHLSPAIAAGTALVMDSQSFIVAESSASPVAVVDPFSGAATNTTRFVVDVMAVGFVGHPGGIASLSPTIAAAASTTAAKRK